MHMINNPLVKAGATGAGIFLAASAIVGVAGTVFGSAGLIVSIGAIVCAGFGVLIYAVINY
jgi:hypothetical protein